MKWKDVQNIIVHKYQDIPYRSEKNGFAQKKKHS